MKNLKNNISIAKVIQLIRKMANKGKRKNKNHNRSHNKQPHSNSKSETNNQELPQNQHHQQQEIKPQSIPSQPHSPPKIYQQQNQLKPSNQPQQHSPKLSKNQMKTEIKPENSIIKGEDVTAITEFIQEEFPPLVMHIEQSKVIITVPEDEDYRLSLTQDPLATSVPEELLESIVKPVKIQTKPQLQKIKETDADFLLQTLIQTVQTKNQQKKIHQCTPDGGQVKNQPELHNGPASVDQLAMFQENNQGQIMVNDDQISEKDLELYEALHENEKKQDQINKKLPQNIQEVKIQPQNKDNMNQMQPENQNKDNIDEMQPDNPPSTSEIKGTKPAQNVEKNEPSKLTNEIPLKVQREWLNEEKKHQYPILSTPQSKSEVKSELNTPKQQKSELPQKHQQKKHQQNLILQPTPFHAQEQLPESLEAIGHIQKNESFIDMLRESRLEQQEQQTSKHDFFKNKSEKKTITQILSSSQTQQIQMPDHSQKIIPSSVTSIVQELIKVQQSQKQNLIQIQKPQPQVKIQSGIDQSDARPLMRDQTQQRLFSEEQISNQASQQKEQKNKIQMNFNKNEPQERHIFQTTTLIENELQKIKSDIQMAQILQQYDRSSQKPQQPSENDEAQKPERKTTELQELKDTVTQQIQVESLSYSKGEQIKLFFQKNSKIVQELELQDPEQKSQININISTTIKNQLNFKFEVPQNPVQASEVSQDLQTQKNSPNFKTLNQTPEKYSNDFSEYEMKEPGKVETEDKDVLNVSREQLQEGQQEKKQDQSPVLYRVRANNHVQENQINTKESQVQVGQEGRIQEFRLNLENFSRIDDSEVHSKRNYEGGEDPSAISGGQIIQQITVNIESEVIPYHAVPHYEAQIYESNTRSTQREPSIVNHFYGHPPPSQLEPTYVEENLEPSVDMNESQTVSIKGSQFSSESSILNKLNEIVSEYIVSEKKIEVIEGQENIKQENLTESKGEFPTENIVLSQVQIFVQKNHENHQFSKNEVQKTHYEPETVPYRSHEEVMRQFRQRQNEFLKKIIPQPMYMQRTEFNEVQRFQRQVEELPNTPFFANPQNNIIQEEDKIQQRTQNHGIVATPERQNGQTNVRVVHSIVREWSPNTNFISVNQYRNYGDEVKYAANQTFQSPQPDRYEDSYSENQNQIQQNDEDWKPSHRDTIIDALNDLEEDQNHKIIDIQPSPFVLPSQPSEFNPTILESFAPQTPEQISPLIRTQTAEVFLESNMTQAKKETTASMPFLNNKPSDRYRQFIEDDSAQKKVEQSRNYNTLGDTIVKEESKKEPEIIKVAEFIEQRNEERKIEAKTLEPQKPSSIAYSQQTQSISSIEAKPSAQPVVFTIEEYKKRYSGAYSFAKPKTNIISLDSIQKQSYSQVRKIENEVKSGQTNIVRVEIQRKVEVVNLPSESKIIQKMNETKLVEEVRKEPEFEKINLAQMIKPISPQTIIQQNSETSISPPTVPHYSASFFHQTLQRPAMSLNPEPVIVSNDVQIQQMLLPEVNQTRVSKTEDIQVQNPAVTFVESSYIIVDQQPTSNANQLKDQAQIVSQSFETKHQGPKFIQKAKEEKLTYDPVIPAASVQSSLPMRTFENVTPSPIHHQFFTTYSRAVPQTQSYNTSNETIQTHFAVSKTLQTFTNPTLTISEPLVAFAQESIVPLTLAQESDINERNICTEKFSRSRQRSRERTKVVLKYPVHSPVLNNKIQANAQVFQKYSTFNQFYSKIQLQQNHFTPKIYQNKQQSYNNSSPLTNQTYQPVYNSSSPSKLHQTYETGPKGNTNSGSKFKKSNQVQSPSYLNHTRTPVYPRNKISEPLYPHQSNVHPIAHTLKLSESLEREFIQANDSRQEKRLNSRGKKQKICLTLRRDYIKKQSHFNDSKQIEDPNSSVRPKLKQVKLIKEPAEEHTSPHLLRKQYKQKKFMKIQKFYANEQNASKDIIDENRYEKQKFSNTQNFDFSKDSQPFSSTLGFTKLFSFLDKTEPQKPQKFTFISQQKSQELPAKRKFIETGSIQKQQGSSKPLTTKLLSIGKKPQHAIKTEHYNRKDPIKNEYQRADRTGYKIVSGEEADQKGEFKGFVRSKLIREKDLMKREVTRNLQREESLSDVQNEDIPMMGR